MDTVEAHPSRPPGTGAPETLIVYRVADLPPALARDLPADAGPRGCLFWIARATSRAISGLMAAIPEPHLDCVDEGMTVATRVGCLAARSRHLAALVRPDEVPPGENVYLGTYRFGFHTAAADVVERHLRDAGCDLRPISDVLGRLAIVELVRGDGLPLRDVVERWTRDGELVLREHETNVPGLFALEAPDPAPDRWALVSATGHGIVEATAPRPGELVTLAMPHDPPPPIAFPSRAVLEAAAGIVRAVHGSALTFEDPDDEGVADATLGATGARGPVRLFPVYQAFDAERFEAYVRGVADVVRPETPADLLPHRWLAHPLLRTRADFAAAVKSLDALADHLGPSGLAEAAPGLEPPAGAGLRRAAWLLLPDPYLHGVPTTRGREAAALLGADAVGRRWLEVALERWVERIFRDGSAVFWYAARVPDLLEMIGAALGPAVTSDAIRRALARAP